MQTFVTVENVTVADFRQDEDFAGLSSAAAKGDYVTTRALLERIAAATKEAGLAHAVISVAKETRAESTVKRALNMGGKLSVFFAFVNKGDRTFGKFAPQRTEKPARKGRGKPNAVPPKAQPHVRVGKTERDRASGKAARQAANRQARREENRARVLKKGGGKKSD